MFNKLKSFLSISCASIILSGCVGSEEPEINNTRSSKSNKIIISIDDQVVKTIPTYKENVCDEVNFTENKMSNYDSMPYTKQITSKIRRDYSIANEEEVDFNKSGSEIDMKYCLAEGNKLRLSFNIKTTKDKNVFDNEITKNVEAVFTADSVNIELNKSPIEFKNDIATLSIQWVPNN